MFLFDGAPRPHRGYTIYPTNARPRQYQHHRDIHSRIYREVEAGV